MWHVWEEDQTGTGVSYLYATRREARQHMRRVRNNLFLSGWLVRGTHLLTGAEVV
ncbi:hypothetical protein [Xylella phage Cota]|uniref:Uncharacterized protein n=1 Tax=Xylella phage Cota TaxID=2699877 RepID=A0A6F8ZKS7_9CAUD|nr:hypothetical protein [Xylella phage Cota]